MMKFMKPLAKKLISSCKFEQNEELKKFAKSVTAVQIYYDEYFSIDFAFNIFSFNNIREIRFSPFAMPNIENTKIRIRQTPELINNDNIITAYDSL